MLHASGRDTSNIHDFPCLSGLLSWIEIKKLIIQIILLPPIKINLSSDIRAVSNS